MCWFGNNRYSAEWSFSFRQKHIYFWVCICFTFIVSLCFCLFWQLKVIGKLDNKSHGQNHTYASKGFQATSPATLGAISMPPKSSLNTSTGPFLNHVWIISLWSGCRFWRCSYPQITRRQEKKITNASLLFLSSKPIACPFTFGKFQEGISTWKSVGTHITRILYFDKHSKKFTNPC